MLRQIDWSCLVLSKKLQLDVLQHSILLSENSLALFYQYLSIILYQAFLILFKPN